MLIRYLVQSAAFETYPVSILFNLQIQCLPVLSPLNVILFYQISALATIESSHNIQCLIFECYRSVEIPSSVQGGNLRPTVRTHIIHLTLVHGLRGQRTADCVDLRLGFVL